MPSPVRSGLSLRSLAVIDHKTNGITNGATNGAKAGSEEAEHDDSDDDEKEDEGVQVNGGQEGALYLLLHPLPLFSS